mgnify:CR=1 FL=1
MAEDNTEQTEETGSKSKKKVIIVIILVAILAIGLSVGVTLFLLSDGSDSNDGAEEPVKMPASYLDIKPAFLVTFNVEGRQRYMQISLSVSSRDASAFNALEYHMPLIRSRLISTYGGMDFNTIKTEAGKVDLQLKTVEIINVVLESEGSAPIENVYFTNFVLQ